MAHATIFAMCGKVLFVASLFRYLTQIGEKGSLFWKKENEA
jgi:hypothetical protein